MTAEDSPADGPGAAPGDLTEVLTYKLGLIAVSLAKKFPNVDEGLRDDALQIAVTEALERRGRGGRPGKSWEALLRWSARNRLLDLLQDQERQAFRRLGASDEPGAIDVPDSAVGPQSVDLEEERRRRQTLTLSQVLQEYCRKMEGRAESARQKEAYERALRGQKPADIAEAMGVPRNTVDQYLRRARTWVIERIRTADVDQSVFLTMHRRIDPE